MKVDLTAVGVVRSSRGEVFDDGWDSETSTIELDAAFGEEALCGLSDFSHLEVIYLFDRVRSEKTVTGARHPRGNESWPRVGLTVCEILAVEGAVVRVRGLDAVDGTPVLDLKPWMNEFGPRSATRQPGWASELMANYWSYGRASAFALNPSPGQGVKG